MRGTVKWFNYKKGYGFITGEDGKEVFVHYSSIQMDGRKILQTDDLVEYEIGNGTTGREQAVNVKVVSEPTIVKCHVLKLDFDTDELVRYFLEDEEIDKSKIEDYLYRVGIARNWDTGFYMVVGHENGKYNKLLGSYAHSSDRELAMYSDKVIPQVMKDMWEDDINGADIIK